MKEIPRSSSESEAILRSVLPEGSQVTLRPMFGNLSAFVGGNMFAGVYGDDLFMRLSEEDRTELLKNEGASIFEPMKGRQMKEYVVLPKPWRTQPAKVKPWMARSLKWSSLLPAKRPKKR